MNFSWHREGALRCDSSSSHPVLPITRSLGGRRPLATIHQARSHWLRGCIRPLTCCPSLNLRATLGGWHKRRRKRCRKGCLYMGLRSIGGVVAEKGVPPRRVLLAANLPQRAECIAGVCRWNLAHWPERRGLAATLPRLPGHLTSASPCLQWKQGWGRDGGQARQEATRIPSSQPSDKRLIPHFSCHLPFVQFSSLFHEYFILRAMAPLPLINLESGSLLHLRSWAHSPALGNYIIV